MGQMQAKQRASRAKSEFGIFFMEVFEACQRPGRGLNFIKKKQIRLGVDLTTSEEGELLQYAFWREVPLKNLGGLSLKLKIEDVDGGKMSGSEIFD